MAEDDTADRRTDEHWERHADAWIAWARTPDHDAFWSYRAGFRAFAPPPGEATLEIGSGEGRIARELTDLGHRVTALERSARLVEASRRAGSVGAAVHHVRGDAHRLPFPDARFEAVVAYNVLMDVEDMPGVVAEIGRVLRPGGSLTLSIVHPLGDRGRFLGDGPGATFVVDVDWFSSRYFESTQARNGLSMTFAGWSYTLPAYVAALRAAGLAVIDLVEPRPDGADARRAGRWDRVPLFLWLRALRLPDPSGLPESGEQGGELGR